MNTLIDAKLAQTPPIVKTWFSADKLRELTEQSLADDIERLTSDNLAKAFQQHAPIESAEHAEGVVSFEAYKTRVLDLSVGQAIGGIRFRSMDLAKPFVNVAITTQHLTADAMAQSVPVLAREFAEFAPKHVRFYVPNSVSITPSDFADGVATWHRVLLANRFADLTATARLPDDFSVMRVENVDFYDDYAQMYAQLFSEKAEYADYTRCEGRDDLQAILDNGGHHVVLHQAGEFAGLMSLDTDVYGGLQGLYVVEKILATHLHGKGLGKAFESEVIRLLRDEELVREDEIFFGEIDADNGASLNCAVANGRAEVRRFLWVTI